MYIYRTTAYTHGGGTENAKKVYSYRDTVLLFDARMDTAHLLDQRLVAEIIVEIQYFANLYDEGREVGSRDKLLASIVSMHVLTGVRSGEFSRTTET